MVKRGGVKRGVAGVRLCDAVGCRNLWPCDLHGTMAIGERQFSSDATCAGCGYHVCACAAPKVASSDMQECAGCCDVNRAGYACKCPVQQKPEPEPAPTTAGQDCKCAVCQIRRERSESKPDSAPATKQDDAPPDGWFHAPTAMQEHVYVHKPTGSCVYSDYAIEWFVRGESRPFRTRTLAMAAALGFDVYPIMGDTWAGYCWKRGSEYGMGVAPGDWRTAEAAALAALQWDAGQRRAKAANGWHPATKPYQPVSYSCRVKWGRGFAIAAVAEFA